MIDGGRQTTDDNGKLGSYARTNLRAGEWIVKRYKYQGGGPALGAL